MSKRRYAPCGCGCKEHLIRKRKTYFDDYYFSVACPKCGFETDLYPTKFQAMLTWNYAHNGQKEGYEV